MNFYVIQGFKLYAYRVFKLKQPLLVTFVTIGAIGVSIFALNKAVKMV